MLVIASLYNSYKAVFALFVLIDSNCEPHTDEVLNQESIHFVFCVITTIYIYSFCHIYIYIKLYKHCI